jgi:thiol-disulfide isomerase/thioredoxin
MLPAQVLSEIETQFQPPAQRPPEAQMRLLLNERMQRVIALGEQARQQHPQAGDLYRVDAMMLDAALQLVRLQSTAGAPEPSEFAQALDRLAEIATRLRDSAAPPDQRLRADFILMRRELSAQGIATQPAPDVQQPIRRPGDTQPAADAEQLIRQFMQRYQGTPTEARAAAYGAVLAVGLRDRLPALAQELVSRLRTEFPNDADAQAVLRRLRQRTDVGRPFAARLTRLDGSPLVLPADLLGKVVVVDFWATWCPPCVAAAPKMKDLYAKYRGQGLEIVGISLDQDRAALEQFIRQQELPWIQTFSGQAWTDPTAQIYGVDAIPSVWVVGRDGKVISEDAEGAKLEAVIQKALEAPNPG